MQLGARDPSLTVVLAPRESYSRQVGGILDLLARPGPPIGLVVVDEVRCPSRVRERTASLAEEHGFTHVHLDRRAGANECRQQGFDRVTSPFALFLDNDARLADGAVETLLRRADATDASFVAPLCISRDGTVHYAGSVARIVGRDLLEIRLHGHPPADEMAPLLDAVPTDAPELHGVLVRSASLRSAGGFDTDLDAAMDCVDLGLRLQDVDGGGWLEPAAAVSYANAFPRISDLPLYLDRWSRATIAHDIDHFAERWRIEAESPRLLQHWEALGLRRFRLIRYLRGAVRRTLGTSARSKVDGAFDAVLERTPLVTRRR